MTNNEILQKAIYTYGTETQFCVAMEECAELIQAISKFNRNFNGAMMCKGRASELISASEKGADIIGNIIEEIADVEIMITQLKMMLHCDEYLSVIKQAKINRLAERLEAKL